MSNIQKCIWLFSNENAKVLSVFAQFVYACYCKRFELLTEDLELTSKAPGW